ncbi:MAG: 4Fe-4S dicluster domain-containing protein [Desulfomonilia bacterium]
MNEIFRKLQEKLDTLPQGFPAVENGLDIRILQWIFTPEEAKIALGLPFAPVPADAIAERLGKTVKETRDILEKMNQRGQIMCLNISGSSQYLLPPYYPGIHECVQFRKDKTVEQLTEYARLFEDYFPLLLKATGRSRPSLTRVVPVSTAVDPGLKVHRLDDVKRMVEGAKCIHLMECVCRKEKILLGKGCGHSLEVCLMLSSHDNIYDKWPHGRSISAEEAMKILVRAEKEGLVHTTYNADDSGNTFICACCPCCSIFLSALAAHKAPNIVAQSNFLARINEEKCIACGTCANERCPMGAIFPVEDKYYRVEPGKCIGCGVCNSTCPAGAITMVSRDESQREPIPSSLVEWAAKRSAVMKAEGC